MQEDLKVLGMRVEPLMQTDGERAGRLWRQQSVTLADRACLSLGSAASGAGGAQTRGGG
jgi:hypothetical protein